MSSNCGQNPIKVLPESTSRLIYSSQTISTIFGAIKELLENALDSSATNIEIKLIDFGLRKIEVTDNGSGIEENEINLIAKPHYTSKLTNHTELCKLSTYGFRGEALGAICAVSKMTLTTRTKSMKCSVTSSFDETGQVTSKRNGSMGNGTTVIIENIFGNFPVRRQLYKSIKRKKEELTMVELFVKHYAVLHPEIRIALYHCNALIFLKPVVSDVKSALLHVWGARVYSHMDCTSITEETTNISIEAYLPKAGLYSSDTSGSTSDSVFLSVNKRPTRIKEITKVIHQFYSESIARENLAKSLYPLSYFSIKLPLDQVDVNLEPAKMEVHIECHDQVLSLVTRLLSKFYDKVLGTQEAVNQIDLTFSGNPVLNTSRDYDSDSENVSAKRRKRTANSIEPKSEKILEKSNDKNFESFQNEGILYTTPPSVQISRESSSSTAVKPFSTLSENSICEKVFNKSSGENLESFRNEDDLDTTPLTGQISRGNSLSTAAKHTFSAPSENSLCEKNFGKSNGTNFADLFGSATANTTRESVQNSPKITVTVPKSSTSSENLNCEKISNERNGKNLSKLNFDLFESQDNITEISQQCAKDSREISQQCAKGSREISQQCAKDSREISQQCAKDSREISQQCAKDSREISQQCVKDSREISQQCAKDSRENSQQCAKDSREITKSFFTLRENNELKICEKISENTNDRNFSKPSFDLFESQDTSEQDAKESRGTLITASTLRENSKHENMNKIKNSMRSIADFFPGSPLSQMTQAERSDCWSRGKIVGRDNNVIVPTDVVPGNSLSKKRDNSCVRSPQDGVTPKTRKKIQLADQQPRITDLISKQNISKSRITPFALFSREHKAQVLSCNPDVSPGRVNEMLLEKWKNLTEFERERYVLKSFGGIETNAVETSNKIFNQSDDEIEFEETDSRNIKINDVAFSMKNLELSFSQRKKSTKSLNEQSIKLIGQVNELWFGLSNEKIIVLLDIKKMRELVLCANLRMTFKLSLVVLRTPIKLDFLRNENLSSLKECLQKMPSEKHGNLDPYDYVIDPRLTWNGFFVRRLETSIDFRAEIWQMSQALPNYGVTDLIEILQNVAKNPDIELKECRPLKLLKYLQEESVRISKNMPKIVSKSQMRELLKNLKDVSRSCTSDFTRKVSVLKT